MSTRNLDPPKEIHSVSHSALSRSLAVGLPPSCFHESGSLQPRLILPEHNQQAKLVSAASVGLGLLSSGLKKLGRIGGATGGVGRGRPSKSRWEDSQKPYHTFRVSPVYSPFNYSQTPLHEQKTWSETRVNGQFISCRLLLRSTHCNSSAALYLGRFLWRPSRGVFPSLKLFSCALGELKKGVAVCFLFLKKFLLHT